jgi:hypothetical protein
MIDFKYIVIVRNIDIKHSIPYFFLCIICDLFEENRSRLCGGTVVHVFVGMAISNPFN